MKRSALSVYVFTVVGILLSSCSRFSDVSILKRHYRSGYYVETVAISKPVKQGETKLEETQPAQQQTAITPVYQSNQQKQSEFRSLKHNVKGIISAEKIENSENRFKNTGTVFRSLDTPVKGTVAIRRISHESNSTALKHSNDGGEHHGLGGLLWLIIVVLLILFLLNFLLALDLGSLVYIILVVALILLLFRLIGML